MSFDGAGNYIRNYNWTQDAANSIPITASRFDTEHNGFAAGLSNCITRDGQGKPIADISWNSHKIKDLADPSLPQDALTLAFVNSASGLLQIRGSQILFPLLSTVVKYDITPAESAALVTPVNYSLPELNMLRYYSGTGNIDSALSQMFDVLLNKTGGVAVIPPGTYTQAATLAKSLTTSPGANVTMQGATIIAWGVRITFAGTGYCWDFSSPNTSALFYGPLLSAYGLNIFGTAAGAGGLRQSDCSSVKYLFCFMSGFSNGEGWRVRNTVSWSENNHWISCGAVNCRTGIAFSTTGILNSFARTTVHDFFGAGLTDYWFTVGAGCAVYDSRWTHISGNTGALSIFGIGAAGAGADMSATVVDGVNVEINQLTAVTFTGSLAGTAVSGTLASAWTHPTRVYTVTFSNADVREVTLTNGATTATWSGGLSGAASSAAISQQGVIQLLDYPQAAVARRPVLYNVGVYATYTGSGNIPVWIRETGAALAGPESAETQSLLLEVPLQSRVGQSQVYEGSFSAAALRDVATSLVVLQSGVALTGFAAPPSGRCLFTRSGRIASMSVFDPLTAVSNTTAMTLTGIPAEYRPAADVTVPCFVTNNGVFTAALATVTTGGGMTFLCASAVNNFAAANFTAAGNKGLTSNTAIVWPMT